MVTNKQAELGLEKFPDEFQSASDKAQKNDKAQQVEVCKGDKDEVAQHQEIKPNNQKEIQDEKGNRDKASTAYSEKPHQKSDANSQAKVVRKKRKPVKYLSAKETAERIDEQLCGFLDEKAHWYKPYAEKREDGKVWVSYIMWHAVFPLVLDEAKKYLVYLYKGGNNEHWDMDKPNRILKRNIVTPIQKEFIDACQEQEPKTPSQAKPNSLHENKSVSRRTRKESATKKTDVTSTIIRRVPRQKN